jgi:hypothetical protein
MGKTCRTYVGDVKSIYGSGGEALAKEAARKNINIGGKML